MPASRPSTFPSSSSIIRPPETSKSDVVTTSSLFPQINRADSGSRSSESGSGSGSGGGGSASGSVPLSRSNNGLGRRARISLAPLRIDSLTVTTTPTRPITPVIAEEPRERGEPREAGRPGRSPRPESQPASSPTYGWQTPSAPIPIPRRQKSTAPTTPLTARESKGGHFPFVTLSPVDSNLSTSSTSSREYYQSHRAPASASATAAASVPPTEAQKTARRSPNMHDQPLPRYNPSTPFSPTMPLPLSPLQPMSQNPHLPRRAGKSLHLTPLPRFHPANYPSAESGQNAVHRGARASVPQRHGSDASQQLHQYRRDLVDSTAMSARSLLSPKLGKPSSPRLHPLGSPGPVTPLMLEGHEDYLLGGSTVSPDAFTALEGKAFVDGLIREEHDRIKRPGIHSARHSPAISPVGRGAAYRS